MRRSNLALASVLLAVLSGAVAHAQEPVRLAEGRVSFVPPAGFKPMSKEDIAVKFGRKGEAYAPDVVYSNERQNVSVAAGLASGRVAPEQLGEFQKFMESMLEKSIPRVEWLRRERVTVNGVVWIHLSLKAEAIDTDIHNEMYFTPFGDKVVIFNFNSTVAEYEKHKEVLEKSATTITVKP
ncbi:MAG: hypothetical protein QOD28_700 [Acidobacteriota bacterium]|nr:hypothetical protein [Acidobacteriota bacterium]